MLSVYLPHGASLDRVEVGDPTRTDAGWTDVGYQLCSSTGLRLYCLGYDRIGKL